MALKLGLECKIFYKVGGVESGGEWTELTNVKDVTTTLEKNEADVTTRANNGWRALKSVLKTASIEFQMQWDDEDEGFNALKDSWLNNELIGIAVLDGPLESGQGLVADMEVFNFSRNEPLEEAVSVDVSLKPTYSSTAPEWVENGVS